METIIINEKEYKLKQINFGAICQLEKLGLSITSLQNIQENYFSAIQSLTAFVIGCDKEKASEEIENHIAKGGSLNDFTPLFEMITNSDFFQNLSKQNKVNS